MKNSDTTDVRVRRVSRKLVNELIAIAKNCHDLSLNNFLKMKLREISNSYPDNRKIYKD
jgi:hypothetical protein